MDSHTFSDPVLVTEDPHDNDPSLSSSEPQPQQQRLLTWKVQVLRRDAVAVGTLYIHAQNLPPRKRKGKIVWQLPDTLAMGPPRFGPLEQKRLWELFKQQKKERRAQQKRQNDSQSGSGLVVDEENDEGDNDEPNDPSNGLSENGGVVLDALCKLHVKDDSNGRSETRPVEKDDTPTNNDGSSSSTPQPPPVMGAVHHPSKSTATTTTPSSSVQSPLRPPGFETVATVIHTPVLPSASGSQTNTNNNETLPPPPLLRPPPGMIRVPSGIVPSSYQQSYFPLLSTAPLSTLGALVAQTFLQSMTWTTSSSTTTFPTTPTSLPLDNDNLEWLRYYQENAVQTLLVGSVQAPVCTTPAQRHAQWQSLTARTTHWECHGYTIQPVVTDTSTTTTSSTTALVVLTGQTQPAATGVLAYTLTLLLVSSSDRATAADPVHDGAVVVRLYSIANAVVTLLALTAAPTTTTTPAAL